MRLDAWFLVNVIRVAGAEVLSVFDRLKKVYMSRRDVSRYSTHGYYSTIATTFFLSFTHTAG